MLVTHRCHSATLCDAVRQLCPRTACALLRAGNAPPKRILGDRVDKRPLAIDLDDREPLTVRALQPGIAGDVDLDQLEVPVATDGRNDLTRPIAQMTPGRVEERDAGGRYGYRPRVVVASATRFTARP
jgi:hypothetical protein